MTNLTKETRLNLLAFDLGASSGKTFLGSYNGKILTLETIDRFFHSPINIRGELFWDCLAIYRSLTDGIRKASTSSSSIKSLGLDSFSNDFGLLDKDGRFTNQVHCYRDERTKRNAEKIYSVISKQKLHQLSGNQNALFTAFMQLASICLEQQSYMLEGAGSLLFIPDLFTYFLTGEIGSEYTISSVSQMFNFPKKTWSDDIIDVFGLPRRIFPEIIITGTNIGKLDMAKDLPVGGRQIDVIAVCEHDTASAFLAGPFGDDAVIISSGTWSLVGIETEAPIINDFTYQHNIANEGGYPGHHRLLKNVMGLWIVQECQRFFRENGTRYTIEELIELADQAKPLQFFINPNDELFFSPGNMPEKIVNYCGRHGLGIPDTPGEIIRCILESLAFQYRYVIEELEQATGKHFSMINILGGGCKNVLLNQITANATKRIVYAGPSEATAIGNLILQLLSHNEISSIKEGRDVIANSFEINEYLPENSDLWDKKYQDYLQVVRI